MFQTGLEDARASTISHTLTPSICNSAALLHGLLRKDVYSISHVQFPQWQNNHIGNTIRCPDCWWKIFPAKDYRGHQVKVKVIGTKKSNEHKQIHLFAGGLPSMHWKTILLFLFLYIQLLLSGVFL